MLYSEFLQGTNATEGKQSYKSYLEIEKIYMNDSAMTKQEAYALYQKPTRNRKSNTVNGIKVKYFDSMEALENDENEYTYDQIYVVNNGKYIAADMTVQCSSYKTAIRRIFKGLANISHFKGWEDGIIESCESGYFFDEDKIYDYDKGCSVWAGDYHWHVEQNEDTWYVELTVNTELCSEMAV